MYLTRKFSNRIKKICDVCRITIRRDRRVLPTNHLISTFLMPELPQPIMTAYLQRPVRPYTPNPLRCFQCRRLKSRSRHLGSLCTGWTRQYRLQIERAMY
ncbi:hypothetical protein NPIL_520421 [Nephila pilipes]|uniref:Uncharacterized protein n=1 Tax=Nephila pilipes TaxID=299642 RepID=A0A8X6ND26_NEPPI|nr:hypothetical protein NPIL_520421 [Nephila pilipes]